MNYNYMAQTKKVIKHMKKRIAKDQLKLEQLILEFDTMQDFVHQKVNDYEYLFVKTLIDHDFLNKYILVHLLEDEGTPLDQKINVATIAVLEGLEEAKDKLLTGHVLVLDWVLRQAWAIAIPSQVGRSIEPSEQESIVYGPNESFTEQLEQNLTLIRRHLPICELKSESYTVGTLSKSKVYLLYVEGLTNQQLIEKVRRRIEQVDYDLFVNSSSLSTFLEDQPYSIFPQFRLTDRPDATASALSNGQIVVMVNKTPFVIIGPTTFFQLFQSPEDYILRWPIASTIRIIRYMAYFTSLLLLPFYVAITTHHYEALPIELLFIIIDSRTDVPFSPFWEALLMVITMEFLKEASKRMPTKTGQTLGIVGGIIIGEAAVQAGIASNVLIVAVGITAVTSFLVPNYIMATTTKLLRIALLVLVLHWGVYGMLIGITLIIVHLNGLTSLGVNYLSPITPAFLNDWKDTILRYPVQYLKRRPEFLEPENPYKTKK